MAVLFGLLESELAFNAVELSAGVWPRKKQLLPMRPGDVFLIETPGGGYRMVPPAEP